MSAARIAKDQQVVAAVLRDKEPEWFYSALQHGTHNPAGRVGWWCVDNPTSENPGGGWR